MWWRAARPAGLLICLTFYAVWASLALSEDDLLYHGWKIESYPSAFRVDAMLPADTAAQIKGVAKASSPMMTATDRARTTHTLCLLSNPLRAAVVCMKVSS